MSNRWFWEKEDGAATVDYVVVMAVMVGLGVAVSETTTGSLTTHTGNVEDELQDGLFETAWDEHLAVQPVLEDDPCDINGDGLGARRLQRPMLWFRFQRRLWQRHRHRKRHNGP